MRADVHDITGVPFLSIKGVGRHAKEWYQKQGSAAICKTQRPKRCQYIGSSCLLQLLELVLNPDAEAAMFSTVESEHMQQTPI